MEITTELVKELRDKTGVSIMQCKKALEEAGGDMEKAAAILLENSAAIASKKGGRALNSGVVATYVHSNGNIGAMVELLCETDFVAKNEEFKTLARDIAMQITATNPKYIRNEEAGDDEKDLVLLDAYFIKNPEVTIKNLIDSATQKFGENMELSRFVRYSIGE